VRDEPKLKGIDRDRLADVLATFDTHPYLNRDAFMKDLGNTASATASDRSGDSRNCRRELTRAQPELAQRDRRLHRLGEHRLPPG